MRENLWWYYFLFLSHLLLLSFFQFLNNIPVGGLLLDHRDSGALLASGVANKKDKEQMVVFVIPSSFQAPGKPLPPLSLSLLSSVSAPQQHLESVWIAQTSAIQTAS